MKKINKILSFLVVTTLLLTPYYANAEEPTPSPTPTPEASSEPTATATPEPTPTPTPEATKEPEPTATPETKSIKLSETKISLNSNESKTLKAEVTPSDEKIIWKSSDEKIATVDENGKVTAKNKSGEATITAYIKDNESISASCKVTVTSTADATLKSLTIENGTLDKTFDSNVSTYDVTVDKNQTKLDFTNLTKDLSDSNASYQVTGNSNLKNGSVVKIIVTAQDDTTNTYKLTIIKEEDSLYLKHLEINGYALNEIFKKETTEYTASIPYEIETITVNASAESQNATVKTSGLTNLKVGKNTVTVTVSDEEGNKKVYKIIVTREKEVTLEENKTSIITSATINDSNTTSQNIDNKINSDSDSDSFLKYAIVSIACLILFAIGGIGIYFYLKTSPKRLRKELSNKNKETTTEESSPMLEVSEEKPIKKQSNIESIMDEKLIETREFTKEDLNDNKLSEDKDVL